jgi:hypothetical protein
MATKKGTTRKSSSKKATKKATKSKIEQIEKKQGVQSSKKVDGRKNNGGARANSGPKPNADRERLTTLKDQAELHALEEVPMAVTVDGKVKNIKMTRAQALLDMLFTEGIKRKSIPATKEYFDRTRGKARQPIEHSGEIKTEDQYIPDDPAVEAAHNAYMNERKKLIAQGYYDSADGEE